MSIWELFRLALASLRAHKLRALLNLTGILIAVTTIVAVISVISGLNSFASNFIAGLGPNTFIVAKIGIVQSREDFLRANKRKDYEQTDVEAIRRLVPQARRVTGRVFARHPVYAEGRRLPDCFVVGSGAEFPWMVGLEIEDGRYFTEAEARAGRPVAVVGWDVKDEMFPHVDPIGRTVRVQGKPFRIIGLMARQGRAFGQSQDSFVAVPLNAFEKAFGKNRSVDIFVESPDADSAHDVQDAVRTVLRARRGTPFGEPDPFDIVDADALQGIWRQVTFLAFALVICISSVSLVVGGVAIANTMFASIVERTREIGIRKSLGARRRDIRRQFLLEAALLALVGGLLGVGLGWLVALAVAQFSPFPAQVTPQLVATALAVAIGAGLLAGWLPAVRVARLDPVEALREE